MKPTLHQNLISIVKWIDSDTLLRDEDEVVEEVVMELGFKRHGAKIVAAIKSAVRAARSEQAPHLEVISGTRALSRSNTPRSPGVH